jgi:hypothetical protein
VGHHCAALDQRSARLRHRRRLGAMTAW